MGPLDIRSEQAQAPERPRDARAEAPVKVNIARYGYTILQVETSSSCNMACTFCAYPTKNDKQSKLPDALVYKAVDSVDPSGDGFQYVCFSQLNEPLLDQRIPLFIRYAQTRGFKTKIITNGLLLQNPTIAQRTLACPPDLLKISLQTPERKQYEQVRGIALDFDRYIEGIQRFLSQARGRSFEVLVDVGCNFLSPLGAWGRKVLGLRRGDPAVPNTVREMLPAIKEFFLGLKASDPAWAFEVESAQTLVHATSRYWEEQGVRLADNITFKIKPFGYGRRLKEFVATQEAVACKNEVLGVLADGSVVPCCIAYDTTLAMGNLKQESLQAILERNRVLLLEQIKASTNCKPEMCKRCLGQPTTRGVVISRVLAGLKPTLRRL